jgi:signal peptidase
MTNSPADSHQPRPRPRAFRELALTAGAVVGVVCIVAAVASMLFGITPLVFRSGSMSPTIGTGALGLARTVPASEIRDGDIVSVINDAGTRITHRVVAVQPTAGGAAALTLKGDANQVADLAPSVVTSVDRVFFHVERLGYAVSWLSSPTAAFLGGLLVGVLLMVGFRPSVVEEPEGVEDARGDVGADPVPSGVERDVAR